MLNQSNQFLQHGIDPFVQPLLQRVVQAQRLGTCGRIIKVHEFKFKDVNKCDCIDLAVPYADQILKWTVLFDSEFPELGPDFIFNDEHFLANPDVDILMKHVPSLVNWNYCDNDSLLTVLKELLAYYKKYQIDLLRSHSLQRLVFEYESLIENVDKDDVEVIFLNPCMKSAEVKFFIRLVVDFSKIPQRTKHQTQNDSVMLLVSYSGSNFFNVVPSLYLTKSIEDVLGSQETLQIPPFSAGGLLIEYVPEIHKFLKDRVDSLILNFKKKRDFLSSLILTLRGSIIEYDALEFNKATFLVEKKDFHFFINFQIPSGFPREKPEVIMQSAYHMDQSCKMLTYQVTKFTYNPQMEPLQMVQLILTHIEEKEVDPFQQNCIRKYRF